jgi:hypothetical protein
MTKRCRTNKKFRWRTVFEPNILPMIRSLVLGDLTLCESDRHHLLQSIDSCIFNPGGKHPGIPPRILTRSEVAEQFGICLRTVDYWAAAHKLRRIILPGRQRAVGFLEADIVQLLGVGKSSNHKTASDSI